MTLKEYRDWLETKIVDTETKLIISDRSNRDILLWIKHELKMCLEKFDEIKG